MERMNQSVSVVIPENKNTLENHYINNQLFAWF